MSPLSVNELGGWKIADPYFLDLSKNNDAEIDSPWKLIELIDDLKTDIKEFENEHKYWNGATHNLQYGIYLRGQRVISWDLVPTIGRDDEYTPIKERNILHRFRRRSYSHYNRVLSDWENMLLARHHRLPTRMLDWSTNPLVGLYWACGREPKCDKTDDDGKERKEDLCPDKDGAVWAFVRQPQEEYDINIFKQQPYEYDDEGEFGFLIDGVKIIYPFVVSPRLNAQGGYFTIQDKPKEPLETYKWEDYERKDYDIFHVRKWKVPAENKSKILQLLNDVGIDQKTLFPDLDGLGAGLAAIEDMRIEQLKKDFPRE
jgi:hypothetical protein